MRIVCQKCSAAYAIDDKFVTPRGVRAQCPRCRHLQLVKKDDGAGEAAAPAAPAAPAGGAGMELDLSALPPAGAGAPPPAPAPGASPFAFDFTSPPPPGGGAAPPAPSPFNFGAPAAGGPPASAFDFASMPAPPAPAPFGFGAPAPQAPAPDPFGMSAGAPDPSPFDFGSSPPGAPGNFAPPPPAPAPARASAPKPAATPAPAAAAGPPCQSCGKPLTDPFDLALGTCDECRNKVLDKPNQAMSESFDAGNPVFPAGEKRAEPRPLPVSSEPRPPGPSAPAPKVARTAAVAKGGSNKGLVIGGVLGLLVVGGGVGFYFYKNPSVKKAPPRVVKGASATPQAIDEQVRQWRLAFPELEGESAAQSAVHLEAGEANLVLDTTKAYMEAEEEFQKALVLDPSNERAAAGWVMALAFGKGSSLDEATAKAADGMLTALEQRSGDPHLFVAHAHLMMARGQIADAQQYAERGEAAQSPEDKALAALAIGQVKLTKNTQEAQKKFEEALKLNPKLKRAYLYQAQLNATVGKYKDAVEALNKRLSLDPDQWEAARELARLYVEVGEPASAKKVLEAAQKAAPRNVGPKLMQAVLAYQHMGDVQGAVDQLTAIVSDKDVSKPDQADAYVHLAAAHRLQGDVAKAADDVQHAQDLAPDLLSARVQHMLVMLDKNVMSQARLDLDNVKGKLGDPGLESALEGRILVGEGRLDEALDLLTKLAESEPRRVDALLLAGAAAAKARKDGKAWELCLRKGLKADPTVRPVPAMTQLFIRPADVLKPAVGAYQALSHGDNEDPSPVLCEGVVAWFSDDYASAEKSFARVNAIDGNNADAYAFRSLLALKKKDPVMATRLGTRSIEANRTGALGYLSTALALLASNKPDQAKEAVNSAQKYAPAIMATRVMLGEIEARQKNADEARRILNSVLLVDPLYHDAKRVLFKYAL